jgi:hypothetical protein
MVLEIAGSKSQRLCPQTTPVMPGFVPGIHAFLLVSHG